MSLENPLILAELRRRLRVLEGLVPSLDAVRNDLPVVRLGLSAIDAALPWGGLPRGGLHEVTSTPTDIAAHGFAAALLGRLMDMPGSLLWCRVKRTAYDSGIPYGPGLVRFGLTAPRVVFVETERTADALWAMEEGLRTTGLVAVYGEGIALDLTSSRRLQLAAETSGRTAIALTVAHKGSAITAATTRWRVTTSPSRDDAPRSRWCLALTRCRGGNTHSWTVEWDHATYRFDLVAPLANGLLATAAN